MKRFLSLFLAMVACVSAQVTPTFPVKADKNGVLKEPATFWTANADAINSVVVGGGGGGGGTGNVVGPASAVNDRIAVFNLTTGKLIKDGGKTIAEVLAEAIATAEAASQPLDSDLTAIAALTTNPFGRGLLTETSASSARTTLGLGTAATTSATAYVATVTLQTGAGNAAANVTALQAALAAGGSVTIANSGTFYLNDTILLDSNNTLDGRGIGVIFKLSDSTNKPLFRNRNLWSTDKNITLRGFKIDGNYLNNTASAASDVHGLLGLYCLIGFVGVDTPRVEDVTIYQGRTFGVQIAGCSNIQIARIVFDDHHRDGVHLNGPVTGGSISDLTGTTTDDFLALGAWDWTNYSPQHSGVPTQGNIANLVVRNINATSSSSVIRAMSVTGAQVLDVSVSKVYGLGTNVGMSWAYSADTETPAHTATAAEADRISFDFVNVYSTSGTAGLGQQIYLGTVGDMTIRNFVYRANTTTGVRSILAGAGVVRSLRLYGITNVGDLNSNIIATNSGTITSLEVDGVSIFNSAKAFGLNLIHTLTGSGIGHIKLSNVYAENISGLVENGSSNGAKIEAINWKVLGCWWAFSQTSAQTMTVDSANGFASNTVNLVNIGTGGTINYNATGQTTAIVSTKVSGAGTLVESTNFLGTVAVTGAISGSNLSGTNTGDQTTVTGNAGTATKLAATKNIDGQAFDGSADVTVIAPGTHAATGKTTPVGADEFPLVDTAASNVLKKVTYSDLKTTLKAYFDTVYTGGSSGDVTAASTFGTDNRLIRSDGTSKGVQTSGVSLNDSNSLSGILNLTMTGDLTVGGNLYLTGDMSISGTFTADTLAFTNLSGIALGANGGTGVANTGKTITLGGNLTFAGAYGFTGTLTGTTGVTFPTSGTLATTAGNVATATALATPRAIYGNNFDGSTALAQVIGSAYGGTANGFTKVTGPTTSEKTFTLPNANATILTDNAAVTVAQGGTGASTLTGILKGNGTSAFTPATAGTDYLTKATELTTFVLTIDALADSMDYTIGYVSAAFTITELKFVHNGTTSSPSVVPTIKYGTDRSSGTSVVTSPSAVTSTTTGATVTSFNNSTPSAGSFIWITTASKSGTVDKFTVAVTGHY